MKNIFPVVILLVIACGNIVEDNRLEHINTIEQQKINAIPQNISLKAHVKIVKNGELLVDFDSPGAAVMIDEEHLTIQLGSPDQRHSLAVEVENAKAGSFPISFMTENNKAVLIFISDLLPMMQSPKSGSLTITELNETQCTGSFRGETLVDGVLFFMEGIFENIPLKTL